MGTIFEQARAAVSGQVIESLLASPGAYWENGEYWTLNPTRGDRDIGSFSINEAGLWHDFADDNSGDLVDLLVAIRNCSKREAAEEIVKVSGRIVQEDRPVRITKKRDKIAPQIPAPDGALKSLNKTVSASWCTSKHGKPVKGWTYHTADGGVAFAVTRHEKPDGSKDVIPWYYGTDNAWHPGQAYDAGRPLYKLNQVAAHAGPILIVEGEKCADVPVQGYMVTTWAGGASATSRTDWAPLEDAARDGRVIIWPDADDAGLKAAAAIAKRLPGARILTIKDKPQGWDIADAVAEGIDPAAFIAEHLATPKESINVSTLPYTPIGVDHGERFVLSNATRQVINVKTKADMLMLAPLSYWEITYADREKAWFDAALSDLTEACQAAGYYSPTRIRGRGAWHDDDRILYHTGDVLIDCDTGERVPLHEYRGRNIYEACEPVAVASDMITADEGKRLHKIISGASWKHKSEAQILAGWLMLAPICGALKWRPHVWLSGPTQTGKSTIFKLIIEPVLGSKGDGALSPSGATSEAGLRQSLGLDAFPCYVDEFETDTQDRQQQVAKTLFLFRQASSGGTIVKGTVGGKSQEFTARSAFLVASTVDAIDSNTDRNRITTLEIVRPDADKRREQYRAFRDGASELIGPDFKTRFRARSIKYARGIIDAAEIFADAIVEAGGDSRLGDQLGALLAGAWYLCHDEAPTLDQARSVAEPYVEDTTMDPTISEERRCLDTMLHAPVKFDDNATHTVIELVNAIRTDSTRSPAMINTLAVYGIGYNHKHLDIAPTHDMARKLFGRYENTCKELLRRIGHDIGSRRLLGKGYQMIRIDMEDIVGPMVPDDLSNDDEDKIPF